MRSTSIDQAAVGRESNVVGNLGIGAEREDIDVVLEPLARLCVIRKSDIGRALVIHIGHEQFEIGRLSLLPLEDTARSPTNDVLGLEARHFLPKLVHLDDGVRSVSYRHDHW